jgi:hypothetical protein
VCENNNILGKETNRQNTHLVPTFSIRPVRPNRCKKVVPEPEVEITFTDRVIIDFGACCVIVLILIKILAYLFLMALVA